jgi:ribonuclease HII
MTTEQRQRLAEMNDSKQLTFLNTRTQNFDICPGAYKAFSNLIGSTTDREMKMMQTTKQAHSAVVAGMQVKPEHIRKMQFKQYLGLS